jgi:hypothetical protein
VNQNAAEPKHDCPDCAAMQSVQAVQSAVAGLAREVEAMRRAMRQVATAGELARLAQVVAELSETTATLSSGTARAKGGEPEAAPSWLVLPARVTDAATVLTDLTAWMADIYLRYADAVRSLPECWLWHPEIVEELVWLMYAWLAAYRDEDASVKAAGDWHDRLRPGVVRRIADYAKTCSLEQHLPDRATGAATVPVVDAAAAIAAWWADRRDQPGPEPTDQQMIAAARHGRPTPTVTAGGAR